jgi:hypothetical protein
VSEEEVKTLSPEEAQAKAREANESRIADRLAQMEAIADNAEKGRPDDIEGVEKESSEDKAERLAREEDEATARALQTEGADVDKTDEKDSDTKTVNGETYYRQIVNGSEKWQTIKEIRNAAQKVESADEYLHQASESVRNAARAALSHKDEPVKVSKADLADLLRRVALGEDEAIEKLASVIDARPSEVTPDVLRAVDQRLSFRTELAALESEQREILDDPMLSELFQSRLSRLKQEAPETSLATAYRSIGKEIKDRFGVALKGSKTADKLERKRTLSQVPSAAARQSAPLEEEGEEDVGTVIERMAKARGLSPIVHSRR